MIDRLKAHRLTGLTLVFVGLLAGFSALGFAAQGRAGPAVTAALIGLAIAGIGTWRLWRLPPAGQGENRAGEPTQ